MSGSWLKVEIATPEKPEILKMSEILGIDPDAVFGKLFRVWSWFDEHTTDGHAPTVTMMHLDRKVGVENFCAAMIETKWMKRTEKQISIPNFTRHHTKPSKDRALANLRKQAQRQKEKNQHPTYRHNQISSLHSKTLSDTLLNREWVVMVESFFTTGQSETGKGSRIGN